MHLVSSHVVKNTQNPFKDYAKKKDKTSK